MEPRLSSFFDWQKPVAHLHSVVLKSFVFILLTIVALCGLLVTEGLAQESPSADPGSDVMEMTAEGPNTMEGGIWTAEDNVVLRYKGDVVYCDRAVFDVEKKLGIFKGNVRIFLGEATYRGDTMIYNFETKAIQSADFRMAQYPLLVAGDEITTPGLDHYRIHDGFFTTDNRVNPAWKFRASRIEIYKDDEVVLKNVWLYIGPVPVMWVPIYVQSLKDDREGYEFVIGQSNRMGAYLLNRYHFVLNDYTVLTARLDGRTKRGLAGGADLEYQKDGFNKILFRGYYANDNLYSDSPEDLDPADSDSKFRYGGVGNDDRYRLQYQMRMQASDDMNVVADFNEWSDPFVTLDFFESEYRKTIQPDNMIAFDHHSPNFQVYGLGRYRLDAFFEQVQRKPDIVLDIRPQKIFNSPIEYVSQSSMTSFQRVFSGGPSGTIQQPQFFTDNLGQIVEVNGEPFLFPSYSAYRWDTFHQISYPNQYFNWLNFKPSLGLRGTAWSNSNVTLENIDDDPKNPVDRGVPVIAAESSFKVSKVFPDVKNEKWAIDGIRHVAEPFIHAQYIPTVLGATPGRYQQVFVDGSPILIETPGRVRGFDTRLPSDKLQPISFPAYNSIDSITRQAVIRHGVRNKIQTKRDGRNWDLADWTVYADVDLNHNFSVTENQSYSNVFSDLQINPAPWLSFHSFGSLDVTGNSYNEFNNVVTWQPIPALQLSAGNRFIDDSVLFPNSNLLTFSAFYRLNEHWQFFANYAYDSEFGILQEQRYTIYRDLSAWQAAFTFAQREINEQNTELVFFLTLTLKAFPKLSLSTTEFGSN
jgi:LPS-assembly protein